MGTEIYGCGWVGSVGDKSDVWRCDNKGASTPCKPRCILLKSLKALIHKRRLSLMPYLESLCTSFVWDIQSHFMQINARIASDPKIDPNFLFIHFTPNPSYIPHLHIPKLPGQTWHSTLSSESQYPSTTTIRHLGAEAGWPISLRFLRDNSSRFGWLNNLKGRELTIVWRAECVLTWFRARISSIVHIWKDIRSYFKNRV